MTPALSAISHWPYCIVCRGGTYDHVKRINVCRQLAASKQSLLPEFRLPRDTSDTKRVLLAASTVSSELSTFLISSATSSSPQSDHKSRWVRRLAIKLERQKARIHHRRLRHRCKPGQTSLIVCQSTPFRSGRFEERISVRRQKSLQRISMMNDMY